MKISVIIPTLNEAQVVSTSIEKALGAGGDELIIADGGSTDDTVSIASSLNCQVVVSQPGRGIQLNAGAKNAKGDVLLFLHADTFLPVDGCDQIRDAISGYQVNCGAFNQRIDSKRRIYRLIEFGNRQRIRWFGMAYGDQGMFVRRNLFEKIGGFDEVPLMEDFLLSRKLRKSKQRLFVCPGPLVVSSRRWEKNGAVKQTLKNWSTIASFVRGTDVKQLAERYR